MKNFVQPGKTLTLPAPVGGVVSGGFYKIGAIFGVAAQTAAAGKSFDLEVGEVYRLPKTAAEAWTIGAVIYATSGGIMTTTASGNTKVGVAVEAAADPSATGVVRLNSDF